MENTFRLLDEKSDLDVSMTIDASLKKIVSLIGIEKYSLHLTDLDVSHNHITNLGPLRFMKSLEILNISYNINLKSLEGIENSFSLKQLHMVKCNVSSLQHLRKCVKLSHIGFSFNSVTNFDGLQHCVNLNSLSCSSNNGLNSIKGLPNKTINVSIFDTPLDHIYSTGEGNMNFGGCPYWNFGEKSGTNSFEILKTLDDSTYFSWIYVNDLSKLYDFF